jgi:hypothetical protein
MKLAKIDDSRAPSTDRDWEIFYNLAYAAYALGIAVGQLTSPQLFAKGGAR